MGGLAARHYIREHGAGRVAKLVTIASPHHGTMLAAMGLGLNAREMHRGSAFLESLSANEAAHPPDVDATSIYSPHDNLVSPQDTSRLAWARNVAIPGVGHVHLLSCERTFELVLDELAT
jgi:triacylglycerol esterase/lipase EstA (alpha/beta hydrolase family)